MSKIRTRFLTTGLVVLAAGLPAVAQAQVENNPSAGTVTPVPVAPPASVALAQAAPQGQPSQQPAVAPPAATSADSAFDWGDAGIGAGGAVLILAGAGAVVVAGRRRRTERPLAG